jgi:hypothetical protein
MWYYHARGMYKNQKINGLLKKGAKLFKLKVSFFAFFLFLANFLLVFEHFKSYEGTICTFSDE